jgi:hypothetical protein
MFMECGGKVRAADGDAAWVACEAWGAHEPSSATSQSAAAGGALQKEEIMRLLR